MKCKRIFHFLHSSSSLYFIFIIFLNRCQFEVLPRSINFLKEKASEVEVESKLINWIKNVFRKKNVQIFCVHVQEHREVVSEMMSRDVYNYNYWGWISIQHPAALWKFNWRQLTPSISIWFQFVLINNLSIAIYWYITTRTAAAIGNIENKTIDFYDYRYRCRYFPTSATLFHQTEGRIGILFA